MKFGILLALTLAFFCTQTVSAQKQVIALHKGTDVRIYYTVLDSAMKNAADGDTLYLPGATYLLPAPFVLDKKLVIVGAGFHADTSSATGYTSLMGGDIRVMPKASGGVLTGVYLNGSIYFGDNDSTTYASNFTITRCNVRSIVLGACTTDTCDTKITDVAIYENVVRGAINGVAAKNIELHNNIVEGNIENFGEGAIFSNNLFLSQSGSLLTGVTGALIQNNIMLATTVVGGLTEANDFRNNIFINEFTIPDASVGANNQMAVDIATLFDTPITIKFDPKLNYAPKTAATSINAGTDGTDIGVTGGSFPINRGFKPFNPHIRKAKVANYATPNGELSIEFEVEGRVR